MMPRSVRPLSVVTVGDSSGSTDTFVVDSPCCIKRASFRVLLLVTATDATNVHLDVGSDPGKKSVSGSRYLSIRWLRTSCTGLVSRSIPFNLPR